jgi:hypothetical protein
LTATTTCEGDVSGSSGRLRRDRDGAGARGVYSVSGNRLTRGGVDYSFCVEGDVLRISDLSTPQIATV